MLADSLAKPGYAAWAVMESSSWSRNEGDALLVLPSKLAIVGKQEETLLFSDEDLDDINPVTDPVAFDTLLHDESLSAHDREIMRMKYE